MSPAGWRRLDRVVVVFCRGSAIAAASVVVLVVVFLIVESGPALSAIGLSRFALDGSWNPTPDGAVGRFGLLPMVFGSLAVTAGALAMAVPLGLGVALFAREMAPRAVGRAARRVLALLAGVPSVVYGLWGLVTLVPLIGRIEPPGPSLLAGAVVLGLMILPTVALLADAALAEVPTEHRRAAAALGLSRTATVFGVLLPAARGGIVTGILLAIGRALGETMAVLMVCGNVVQVPSSLFDPVRTLTANIALEMAYALDDHRSALFASGLLLTLVVTALVVVADRVERHV